jgi:hypothetical protein
MSLNTGWFLPLPPSYTATALQPQPPNSPFSNIAMQEIQTYINFKIFWYRTLEIFTIMLRRVLHQKWKDYFDNNPLTPELNSSAQRCLTKYLLGIFLLDPCISLTYA